MTRCNGYWARGKTDTRWYTHDERYRLSGSAKCGWAMEARRMTGWVSAGRFATMEEAKDAAERGTL